MISSRAIANRFKIQELLGRGGMGEVYRAVDTQTGETVAVKALNPEVLANDPKLLERFVREGEALRRLNHHNIVHMVAAVEEQGRHYLVMEFVEGGSLRELLNARGSLPANEVLKIALEVADALVRAHHLKIIHRDLKPGNILLAKDGTPLLADFGIAHVQDSLQITETGILVGTVDYLSPELCQGELPSECSDIWAFGVMLFEMLTGKLPFEGKSVTAKITAILHQHLPDLSRLVPDHPDALIDLVYRMLEKDAYQRISSVRLVGAELEAVMKGRESVIPSRVKREESRFATPTPGTNYPKHNLPVQPTPFVGREAELVELDRLLADRSVRLLSIVGVGGMGKTRLAVEAGARQLEYFQHGVYFVTLAGIQAVEDIVPATAQALGFSFYESREPRQQLLDYLREKKMLLIFDNFEHLLGGVSFVADILHAARDVIVLCTTRLRLGISEEHIYQLSGMDVPDWETPANALEYSAVKLFMQSARRVRPGFELAAGDVEYVARICHLVGGMPLGILLAAAWLEMLTPAEIATEMQNSLDFLATGLPGVDERQRSIRAVLDYSWNALSEQERNIFQQMSVFRGGFTRGAVQAVTGASLRDLMGFVNKSLLTRVPSGRYEIHELLRQYAAENLHATPAEEESSRHRHAAYYADFLQARTQYLHTRQHKAVMLEVGAEIDNVRQAWDRAVSETNVWEIDHSLDSLAEFYRTRGLFREASGAFARASDALGIRGDTRLVLARVLAQQGLFSEYVGERNEAERLLYASWATALALNARREMAVALSYMGGSASLYGGLHGEPCQEALNIFRELEDHWGIATTLRGLGWVALHACDYSLAGQRFQQSVDVLRDLGDPQGLVESLAGQGYTDWIMGNYEHAHRIHEEMLELSRENGDRQGIARAIAHLAQDIAGLQDIEGALRLFGESLAVYSEIGDVDGIVDVVGDMAEMSNVLGHFAEAVEYANQSLKQASKRSAEWDLRIRGVAHLGLGNIRSAKEDFHQLLQLTLQTWRPGWGLHALADIAALFAAQEERVFALELLALVFSDPRTWQWVKDKSTALRTRLQAVLPSDVVAAAEARGRTRDLKQTIQELLVELGENS